jgi:hypothetical protein
MKKTIQTAGFLALVSLLIVGVPFRSSAGLPKHLTKVQRIAAPPSGKALVNFHRPSNWGGAEKFAIFDINGKMLMDLPGGCEFQMVCDPGERVFIAWADHVTVVKADLAADKTYDIMVDIAMGWVRGNIMLIPMEKNDARRDKLDSFEKREKRVVALNRNKHVEDYEAKNKDRIEQIKKDFLSGEKSDRVKELHRDDCR